MISLTEFFEEQLAVTQWWCRLSIDRSYFKLRSQELITDIAEWRLHMDQIMLSKQGWINIVKALQEQRRVVTDLLISHQSMDNSSEHGKLLAFQFGSSLHDGGSQYASDGYFDSVDSPPWDTWLIVLDDDYITEPLVPFEEKGYLLSWVPYELIATVQSGIESNTTGCLRWVTDVSTPLINELKTSGDFHL